MKPVDTKKVFEIRAYNYEKFSLTLNIPYGAKNKRNGDYDTMFAEGSINIGVNTPHGPASIPLPIEFKPYSEAGIYEIEPEVSFDPIERYLQICFSTYEEVAKAAFEEFKRKRQEQNLIVAPSQVGPKGQLISLKG